MAWERGRVRMSVDEQVDAAVVAAAQAGDERALDELVAGYLPLVYNIVGRALSGHADVDDVVQETMLRVVHGIDGLRDPSRFRSWLVAITMRQVSDRWRARQGGAALFTALGPTSEVADPGADFVDLTITRLGLSGERRQVAEATGWLDPDDRRLLSLWWLEAAGELTRAELAAALRLSSPHAAVRVQRMKAQLDTARVIVRALSLHPRCPQLVEAIEPWDGRPSALWRKRIARHVRQCGTCVPAPTRLVPAEALLAGLGLVPPPALAGAHLTVTLGVPAAHAAATAAGGAGYGSGWLAHGLKFVAAKPVAVAAAVAVAVSGAVVVYAVYPSPRPHVRVTLPSPSPTPSLLASLSASPSAPASSASPAPTATTQQNVLPAYGSTVDEVDAAPAKLQKPGVLPVRPAATPITATGKYEATTGNPNKYVMNFNGDYLTLRGQGYVRIRWQIIYTTGRIGVIAMPSWTGLSGKLFHVASGGTRRMDDVNSGSGSTASTGMGSPSTGFDTLPAGAQQMWQNEYYYLDGTVTLHQNQGWAENNLIVEPMTWQQITDDVDVAPTATNGVLRYGLVRDTGGDGAPVPQYLTRGTPSDPATVPQRSNVG
jgi:RNA polymerase sigma factor (sigma-70 family)